MLIALSTLCQFDSTAATAEGGHVSALLYSRAITRGACQGLPRGEFGWGGDEPSVPSDRVDNFSASICIWSARPALRACRSLREASSAFFSAMRARRTGDWPEGCEPPRELDWLRMCEGRVRVGYAIAKFDFRIKRLRGIVVADVMHSMSARRLRASRSTWGLLQGCSLGLARCCYGKQTFASHDAAATTNDAYTKKSRRATPNKHTHPLDDITIQNTPAYGAPERAACCACAVHRGVRRDQAQVPSDKS